MDGDLGGLDRVAANERRFFRRTGPQAAGSVIVLECECARATCDRRIELTRAEYQPIRSSAARYAIYPDEAHVDPRLDRLVDRRPTFWIVERESTIEVLEFFSSAPRSATTEVAVPVHAALGSAEPPADGDGPGPEPGRPA